MWVTKSDNASGPTVAAMCWPAMKLNSSPSGMGSFTLISSVSGSVLMVAINSWSTLLPEFVSTVPALKPFRVRAGGVDVSPLSSFRTYWTLLAANQPCTCRLSWSGCCGTVGKTKLPAEKSRRTW